jgi:hypothetical protein
VWYIRSVSGPEIWIYHHWSLGRDRDISFPQIVLQSRLDWNPKLTKCVCVCVRVYVYVCMCICIYVYMCICYMCCVLCGFELYSQVQYIHISPVDT